MLSDKQIKNIIWHIETNRAVLGVTKTLDQVLESLKNNSDQTDNEAKNSIHH